MKKILATVAILGLSTGAAQASLTINGTHDGGADQFETYFIQATTGGSSDIYLSSTGPLDMDGILSVWQQMGANWQLVGANDNAPFSNSTGINSYGIAVHNWVSGIVGGISDPGLTLNLAAGATYMIIDSNVGSGPTSLAQWADAAGTLAGSLGQTIAVGSNLLAALRPDALGYAVGAQINPYSLTVTGNVLQTSGAVAPAAVPLPAAIWLFGSALAGFGVIGRKKSNNSLVA